MKNKHSLHSLFYIIILCISTIIVISCNSGSLSNTKSSADSTTHYVKETIHIKELPTKIDSSKRNNTFTLETNVSREKKSIKKKEKQKLQVKARLSIKTKQNEKLHIADSIKNETNKLSTKPNNQDTSINLKSEETMTPPRLFVSAPSKIVYVSTSNDIETKHVKAMSINKSSNAIRRPIKSEVHISDEKIDDLPITIHTAQLVYNYPPEMILGKAEIINVVVSITNLGSDLKDNLKKIAESQRSPREKKKIQDSILSITLKLKDSLKIEMLDPDSSFKISQTFGSSWQFVDSTSDVRWTWNVIPITNNSEAKLIIKVKLKQGNRIKDFEDKFLLIKVKIKSFWDIIRDWLVYLTNNPAYVISAILIPLIAYFGNRYFSNRAKKKD